MSGTLSCVPWGRAAAAGLFAGLLVVVTACGGGQTTRNITSVLMGPASDEEVEMEGRRPDPPGGPRCPGITLRDGTESMRIYVSGREGDPRQLRHQAAVSEVVRECVFDEDERGARIRIGVAGRLILGAQGQPGDYQLPIRVAVVRVGGEAVWSQLYRVPVTVEPGQRNVRFSHVAEDLYLELPAGESFGHYVIFAGFDELS